MKQQLAKLQQKIDNNEIDFSTLDQDQLNSLKEA